ncbi:hypothetical protein CDL15_Pgr012451 [Punica granatum]|uniref:Uncharacterized protein n=1 Tax=Punica granatum TaxID=22663 RepID=A0A218WZ16_PUNGR|nr:hypothetical protein CDL15_Pgr012451 [Punica granatum]
MNSAIQAMQGQVFVAGRREQDNRPNSEAELSQTSCNIEIFRALDPEERGDMVELGDTGDGRTIKDAMVSSDSMEVIPKTIETVAMEVSQVGEHKQADAN